MPKPKPKIVAELRGVISQAAIERLLQARGGTQCYIPAKVSREHWLAELLGLDEATKLCRHFSVDHGRGGRIDIPLGANAHQHLMDKAIDQLDQSGARSSREIALTLRITQRRVHMRRAARENAE